MPEDLSGNMRNIKHESTLLLDRFKNFQKRNILSVSGATDKRKATKVKRFPRSSHIYQMLRKKTFGRSEKDTL